jgi:hypothetical protein
MQYCTFQHHTCTLCSLQSLCQYMIGWLQLIWPDTLFFTWLMLQWELWLTNSNGWQPVWRAPVIAAVVVVSVLLSCMLAWVLVEFQRRKMLLEVGAGDD